MLWHDNARLGWQHSKRTDTKVTAGDFRGGANIESLGDKLSVAWPLVVEIWSMAPVDEFGVAKNRGMLTFTSYALAEHFVEETLGMSAAPGFSMGRQGAHFWLPVYVS
jgi:hypothetical protein